MDVVGVGEYRERLFLTRSNPKKDTSYLSVMYEIGRASSEEQDFRTLIAEGAISAKVWFYPTGSEPDFTFSPGKEVEVRGHAARMQESRTDDRYKDRPWVIGSNRHFRKIDWHRNVVGGVVVWEIGADPDRYDEERLVSIIDAMNELK